MNYTLLWCGQVGMIALHPVDQQPRIKLYLDAEGRGKGDCSLCYLSADSLAVAVEVLHQGFIRPSHQIQVQPAAFVAPAANTNDSSGGRGGSQQSGNSCFCVLYS